MSKPWLDTWSFDNHVEVYVRYSNNYNEQDCFGFGIELLPRTLELSYNTWRCRFFISLWIISFWFDLPRMKMLHGLYDAKKLLDRAQ